MRNMSPNLPLGTFYARSYWTSLNYLPYLSDLLRKLLFRFNIIINLTNKT